MKHSGIEQIDKTMQRYNIFNQLHKGLQALLYDTAIMIQQTAFCHAAEGKITLEKLDTLLHLFSEHASLEDKHLFPSLRALDEIAICTLERDHQADRATISRLKGLMLAYEQAVNGSEKLEIGVVISHAWLSGTHV